MTKTTADNKPDSRPLGVWVLTIYAALFAGIAPLAVAVIALVSGNATSIPGGSVFGVLGATLVSAYVLYYSLRTWQGQNRARQSFLIFITLHYALIAINNYLLIQTGEIPAAEVNRMWGRVGRGVLYPAIFIWYFTKQDVRSFFDQQTIWFKRT